MALPARIPEPAAEGTRGRIANRQLAPAALCGIFVALLTARFLVTPLDRFDEGLTVTRGALVAAGRLPYRDFWTSYGPLDSMLLGAAFRVFGQDILVERLLAITVAIALAGLAFYACSLLGLRGAIRVLMTGLIALTGAAIPAFNAAVLGLTLALCAIACFLGALQHRDRRLFALAGAVTALTSLARPELGLVIGAGLGAGLLLALRRRTSRPADGLAFCGTAVIVGTLLWLPFVVIASPQALFFDVAIHALRIFPAARRIPLGQGGDAPAVLVFSACFLLVWGWGIFQLVRRWNDAGTPRLLALLGCAVPLFAWVFTRADAAHAMDAWPPTALLLALLLGTRPAWGGRNRIHAAMAAAGVLLFASALVALAGRDLARTSAGGSVDRASLPRVSAWMPISDLDALIRVVDQRVPEGRPIYVGLRHNNEQVFSDTMLYFLAGRRPGTFYLENLPGLTTTDEVQRRMVCQLAASRVGLVVLGPDAAGEPWNLSSRPGSTVLDSWLTAHATGQETIGPYLLLSINPGSGC